MNIIDLSGTWELKCFGGKKTINAVIPGSDIGNLIKAGEIENPLISGDDKIGESLGEQDCDFSRTFDISEEDLKYNHICLKAGGLDTLCTVYINGTPAFETNNAHIPVSRDIKEHLKAGENEIRLRFASSVRYIKENQQRRALPKNCNGIDGAAFLRKPSCHFGWDWGPCVPYAAVTEYIELKCFNREIENIDIKQDTSKDRSQITVSADNADRIYIITPDRNTVEGENGKFVIENPQLWYTREMSGKDAQPLYHVVFENDEERLVKKIGLRSLYLDRSKDEYGENFAIVLNGERIFAKGANVIPFSAIYENSDNSTIDYYLDLAEKSHFNIMRIWGGGTYASEYLMEQCDKRGMLVWQDFCFACLMYPFDEKDFLDNVLEEARVNVRRLNAHPSLALLCGNNEIEFMFSYMPKTQQLVKAYLMFFYDALPKAIEPLTQASYIATSPIGTEPFKECSKDGAGDTHMWSVWHGLKKLDYYQTRYSRFLSEFGLESLPSMKAISTFATEEDLSITSPSFNRHQKCTGGNKKMLFYLTEMFDMPENFEDLPYLTGIIQAECVKNATVHFRQNKGRCNGSVYWQFNDVWNCPSWSSVDFEGVPKALQYKAQEFFAPVCVTCKKEKGNAILFAHNDTLKEVELNIKAVMTNPSLEKSYNIKLKPNSCKRLDAIKAGKNSVLQIKYLDKVITEIFTAPAKLKLKKANIKAEISGNEMTLCTDNFAYCVYIEADEMPDENYFCLCPGEKRTVHFNNPPKDFKIRCANNIKYKGTALGKKIFRGLYRLEPLNIGNFVYYSVN